MNGHPFVSQEFWELCYQFLKLSPALVLSAFAAWHYLTKHELFIHALDIYKKWCAWRGDLLTQNVMAKVEEQHLLTKQDFTAEIAKLDSKIDSVHDELVRDEGAILSEIKKLKMDSQFRSDSKWANTVRLKIMEVVKNMRDHSYEPNDQELAGEYYDLCCWYEDFCESHSDPESEYYYKNDKMVESCKYYKEWYKEKFIHGRIKS